MLCCFQGAELQDTHIGGGSEFRDQYAHWLPPAPSIIRLTAGYSSYHHSNSTQVNLHHVITLSANFLLLSRVPALDWFRGSFLCLCHWCSRFHSAVTEKARTHRFQDICGFVVVIKLRIQKLYTHNLILKVSVSPTKRINTFRLFQMIAGYHKLSKILKWLKSHLQVRLNNRLMKLKSVTASFCCHILIDLFFLKTQTCKRCSSVSNSFAQLELPGSYFAVWLGSPDFPGRTAGAAVYLMTSQLSCTCFYCRYSFHCG